MTTLHDEDPPLSEGQRLLTLWVDGALSPKERTAFEKAIAQDPELAAQAAQHKEILDLSRSMQMMEPSDIEARRFWARFYNRSEWQIGWCLLLLGAATLLVFALWQLMASDLHWIVKAGTLAVLVGSGILLWNSFRLKLRASRFDRYRGVLY